MNVRQLELWEELRSAQAMPEQVNVVTLLDAMEEAIAQTPETDRLQVVGEALLRVAELCAARSDILITQWEAAYRDPIVDRGFFGDVVRQTMAVDLSDLMEPAPPRKQRKARSASHPQGSIAAPVEKAAVLALVEQWETEAQTQQQQVLDVAHSEDVTAWARAIAAWLQAAPSPRVSLSELSKGLGMEWIEVWLGVLLGGFELEQAGEFYQSPIWVQPLGVSSNT